MTGHALQEDIAESARAFLSLAFAPGEAAQVDWGSAGTITLGATRRRLSFFNLLTRGESTGGVLRFPIPTAPGTVTWEQLNTGGIEFRFGENKGPNWDSGGRNFTFQVAVDDGKSPATLVNNLGEPLSRLERLGSGKFEQSGWLGEARTWAGSGNKDGKRIQVADSFLGNDVVTYTSAPNRPWMRDFNPRFAFPCTPEGRPLVNGSSADGNPWRNGAVWGFRSEHTGWHTKIDPMEFPTGSGSVIWGTQKAPPLGQARIVLYDLPTGDLLSPGQLQHVNLGGRDRPMRPNPRVAPEGGVNASKPGQAATIQHRRRRAD